MKKIICLLFAGCLCFPGFARDKDDEPDWDAVIKSVNQQSGESSSGVDTEILKVNTYQTSSEKFEGTMRVSMMLVGKNGKVAYSVATRQHSSGSSRGGDTAGMVATGAVNWECVGECAALKHPKLKAYTVEYGYMEGGEFVVLDSEYKKTDSFEELRERCDDALRLKMKLSYTWWVN